MIASVGQAVPKKVDVMPAKNNEISENDDEFSTLFSQAIKEPDTEEKQSTEQQNQVNSGSVKEQKQLSDEEQQIEIVASQPQVAEVLANLFTTAPKTIVCVDNNSENVQQINTSPVKAVEIPIVDAQENQTSEMQVVSDVKVNVKPMLEVKSQITGEQATQIQTEQTQAITQEKIPMEKLTKQVQNVLTNDSTQLSEKPIEISTKASVEIKAPVETKVNVVDKPTVQNVSELKQSEDGQTQKVKTEFTQPSQQKEVEQSVQMPISSMHKNAESKVEVNTTKDEQLPIDNVTETKVQPKELNFVQEVKVSDTLPQKEVVNQVLKQLESKFNTKTSEFNFNLYPKELGKVAVKMAVEDGMLVVEIAASNAKAQSILAANSTEIKNALQSQLDQKQVQFVDASQNAQQHDDYLDENNQNHRGNQNFEQNNQNQQTQDESDNKFTSDFLSVMQMVDLSRT